MFLVFDAIGIAVIITGLALFWDSRLGKLLLVPIGLLAGLLSMLLFILIVAPFAIVGWLLDLDRKIEQRQQRREQQRERDSLERWRERGRNFAQRRER